MIDSYYVGGCVRDAIIKKKSKDISLSDIDLSGDIDIVVTNSSEEMMINLGFKKIGKSFNVFIHPAYGHNVQFALARTENSTGSGHNDFTCNYEGVTLEQDLQRRDFTCNAIAISYDGVIVDPFNGADDLLKGILRPVDPVTFVEDPLRMFRGARFATKEWVSCLDETFFKLCKGLNYDTLSPERIMAEMRKAFVSEKPSIFFDVVCKVYEGNSDFFNTIKSMQGLLQNPIHHPEGDVYIHTMKALDLAAQYHEPLEVLIGVLTHDFGKVWCESKEPMKFHGHESWVYGDRLHELMLECRFKTTEISCCIRGLVTHLKIHNLHSLKASTIVDMLYEITPKLVKNVSRIAMYDALCREQNPYAEHWAYLDKYSLLQLYAKDIAKTREVRYKDLSKKGLSRENMKKSLRDSDIGVIKGVR